MSKKSLVLLVVISLTLSLALAVSMSFAADPGPEEIVLNADGTKPATFPHKAHQDRLKNCGACHHYLKENLPVPCDDGSPQESFQKCTNCHNEKMENEKLRTWKDIGHGLCKDCHTKMKDEGAPTKCGDCHKKAE